MNASGGKTGGGDVTVYRGNVTEADWEAADLTIDDAYHDLDLSSVVPVGTTHVQMVVQGLSADITMAFQLKEKDSTNAVVARNMNIRVTVKPYMRETWLAVNADRIVEYNSTVGTWLMLRLTVTAWKVPA